MAIVQCPNGHHYDNSKFDECPHCKSDNPFFDVLYEYEETVAFPAEELDDYDKTIDFHMDDPSLSDNEKTIGAYSFEFGNELITGWIVCIKGPARGKDFRLYHGWNRMGRNMSMDIYVPDDKKISADSHAAIVFDDKKSKFFLVNENGALTYLNGEQLTQSTEILSGDKITAGDSEFIFIAFCTEERKWEEE